MRKSVMRTKNLRISRLPKLEGEDIKHEIKQVSKGISRFHYVPSFRILVRSAAVVRKSRNYSGHYENLGRSVYSRLSVFV
ncbi:hypothetical protein R1flu_019926 [Riccia fluitans]|uniref:Uncharacterized protein n=1 Tax=Riccia fluitans TaxID=41844 RepID=A0ABD1ZKA1_9MARC